MLEIETLGELRTCLNTLAGETDAIGFVPTMGNLHDGHLALVECSNRCTKFTVVSVFVNPFQFGEGEDFKTYPRTLDSDLNKLAALDTDLVFMPSADELYPNGTKVSTRVEVPELGQILCGASRPGFFRGVCTVVNILLNMVMPNVAFFGAKDYQQLLIIRRMVADLRMQARIESVDTVREADGLAMSSRNIYLDENERARAAKLYEVLVDTRDRLAAGDTDVAGLEARAVDRLAKHGFVPDYVAVRRAADLAAVSAGDRQLRVLAAASLGSTRLIDNLAVDIGTHDGANG